MLALAEWLVALLPQPSAALATGVTGVANRQRAGVPVLWLVFAGLFFLLFGMGALGLLPGQ